MTLDETHDPTRTSWVASADGHADFPIQNLPLGVFSSPDAGPRAGVAIGDEILDLKALSEAGLLPHPVSGALMGETLNALLGLPSSARKALRRRLSALLSDVGEAGRIRPFLRPAASASMHLPAAIGDYSDFYVGIHHAENVGRLFRPDAPLLPNYKHVPIGYHGRASSIRISGVPVVRPQGQAKAPDAAAPTFGPCRRLDYEVELAIWIGPGNGLGEPIPIGEADEHVAGLSLLNDWSARDIQAWEYQPLGPFLAKSFHTTVSPWIVTGEALAPFRIPQPPRAAGDPEPLAYLSDEADRRAGAYAIEIEASLTTAQMREAGAAPHRLSRGQASAMYWTVAQIVTHQASNGCNLSPGDLLGSGTLSGPTPDSFGSLLEITRGGADPIALPNGETRTFLEDGDEVAFTGRASAPGRVAIGFGPCRATILPAR